MCGKYLCIVFRQASFSLRSTARAQHSGFGPKQALIPSAQSEQMVVLCHLCCMGLTHPHSARSGYPTASTQHIARTPALPCPVHFGSWWFGPHQTMVTHTKVSPTLNLLAQQHRGCWETGWWQQPQRSSLGMAPVRTWILLHTVRWNLLPTNGTPHISKMSPLPSKPAMHIPTLSSQPAVLTYGNHYRAPGQF